MTTTSLSVGYLFKMICQVGRLANRCHVGSTPFSCSFVQTLKRILFCSDCVFLIPIVR